MLGLHPRHFVLSLLRTLLLIYTLNPYYFAYFYLFTYLINFVCFILFFFILKHTVTWPRLASHSWVFITEPCLKSTVLLPPAAQCGDYKHVPQDHFLHSLNSSWCILMTIYYFVISHDFKIHLLITQIF